METKKVNKTPQEKIAKSSARYYEKKDQILKNNCLKHVAATGNLPLETTINKYNITWQEICESLQLHIRENSIVQLVEPTSESQALKKYRKLFPRSSRRDDLTYIYEAYINTHCCDICKEWFTNERRRVCNLDKFGFFTKIICSECSTSEEKLIQAEQTFLQEEEKLEA